MKSNFKKMASKAQSGFTLIELVIVIVIIGILAAVAIPQFGNISGDATTAKSSYEASSASLVTAVSSIKAGNAY